MNEQDNKALAKTGNELAMRGETALASPADVVKQATAQADALMDIVNQRQLFTQIGNKKFLEAEAWQIISTFNETGWVTEWTRPVEVNGEIVAYEAKVNLVKRGEIVGSAIMSCGLDDDTCKSRQGWDKHKTAMSAAETWAGAKASRMKFAWVAVLAGFSPTPAEEMINQKEGERIERRSQGLNDAPLCPVHKKPMRHNVKGWYCPTKVGDGWCQEKPVTRVVESTAHDTVGEGPSPVTPTTGFVQPVSNRAPAATQQATGQSASPEMGEGTETESEASQRAFDAMGHPERIPVSVETHKKVMAAIAAGKVNEAQVKKFCNVSNLADMTEKQAEQVLKVAK